MKLIAVLLPLYLRTLYPTPFSLRVIQPHPLEGEELFETLLPLCLAHLARKAATLQRPKKGKCS